MKILVAISLLLSSTAFAGTNELKGGIFFMMPSQGYAVTHPCSGVRYQADEYWIPNSEQIVILESRLQAFLTQHSMKTAVNVPLLPLSKWHRQYIGFTRFGRKYIYGMFYPSPGPGSDYNDETPVSRICDWGQSWGVLFSDVSASIVSVDPTGCLCVHQAQETMPKAGIEFGLPTLGTEPLPKRVLLRFHDDKNKNNHTAPKKPQKSPQSGNSGYQVSRSNVRYQGAI